MSCSDDAVLILATLSNMREIGIVLDIESGASKTIPVRPEFIDPTVSGARPCLPFGITWSSEELFIANNRQLLVFDKQLEYSRTESTPLQTNTHQLAYHADLVWATSPWTNSLIGVRPNSSTDDAVEFALFDQILRPYNLREASEVDDISHVNSLLWADECLFVAAHNFTNPSFIIRCHEAELKLDSISYDIGLAIHGLALFNKELYWISTGTHEIRSSTGCTFQFRKEGFFRGLAMTSEHFIVGISEFKNREARNTGDCWIQVIDRRQGDVLAEFHLRGTGNINDLRLLDEYDYAHCINPFWAADPARLESIVPRASTEGVDIA